jgi:hypothetical protein
MPDYDCGDCRSVYVTVHSNATSTRIHAHFSFVNASIFSNGTPSYASGLLLQLQSSAFPPFPALSSCTVCLTPFTPSLPPGSYIIGVSTYNATLLPSSPINCTNSSSACPLSRQPFDAGAPIDSLADGVVLQVPYPAIIHPSSIPPSSTRTLTFTATPHRFPLPANASFTAVSSGADFGCGLTSSASQCVDNSSNIYCWGSYNMNTKW